MIIYWYLTIFFLFTHKKAAFSDPSQKTVTKTDLNDPRRIVRDIQERTIQWGCNLLQGNRIEKN